MADPQTSQAPAGRRLIDPRGPRFGAAVTTVVLAVVLLTIPSTTATVLLAIQAAVFAIGAFAGLRAAPYGLLYARLVRPRLGPPSELEEAAPPQFAQSVGMLFATLGLLGLLLGATPFAVVMVALALAAAFLNAAFGFCLGCELYLVLRRLVLK
jgi:hypothetical protein